MEMYQIKFFARAITCCSLLGQLLRPVHQFSGLPQKKDWIPITQPID